jgi:hypothetical protein
MKLTEDQLKDLIRRDTSRSVRGDAGCPDRETLRRVVAGEVDRRERRRILGHLRSCSDCALEYRVSRSFRPWMAEVESLTGSDPPESASRRIGSLRAVPARGSGRRPIRTLFPIAHPRYLLVASIMVVIGAVGLWIVMSQRHAATVARLEGEISQKSRELQAATQSLEQTRVELEHASRMIEENPAAELQKVPEISRPPELAGLHLNVPIIDLDPAVSRGESDPKLQEIPAGGSGFVLILHTSGDPAPSRCDFEILDQRSKQVTSGKELRRNREGTFTMTLTRSRFRPGRYRIRLLDSNDRALLQEYVIALR